MKTALVLMSLAGFPYQFSSIVKHSVANSCRKFHSPGSRTKPKKIFNGDMNIYVTPGNHLVTKVWDILKEAGLKDTSAAESKRWLSGPHVEYWPQQFNFFSFLRHQGMWNFLRNLWQRSISGTANKSFFINFVCIYITVRRILYQMGGIFSASDSVLYREIQHLIILIITIMTWLHTKRYWCNEFRMNSSGDFLLTREKKNSLGCVYVYATRGGVMKTGNSNPGFNKFSYEGGGSNQRKPGLKNSL